MDTQHMKKNERYNRTQNRSTERKDSEEDLGRDDEKK